MAGGSYIFKEGNFLRKFNDILLVVFLQIDIRNKVKVMFSFFVICKLPNPITYPYKHAHIWSYRGNNQCHYAIIYLANVAKFWPKLWPKFWPYKLESWILDSNGRRSYPHGVSKTTSLYPIPSGYFWTGSFSSSCFPLSTPVITSRYLKFRFSEKATKVWCY